MQKPTAGRTHSYMTLVDVCKLGIMEMHDGGCVSCIQMSKKQHVCLIRLTQCVFVKFHCFTLCGNIQAASLDFSHFNLFGNTKAAGKYYSHFFFSFIYEASNLLRK